MAAPPVRILSRYLLRQHLAPLGGPQRRETRPSLAKRRHGAVAPPQTEPPRATAQPAPAESGLSALISPVDPEGAQIVWMLKSRMGGGLHRLWALVSESEGLVGAQVVEMTRRELRTQRKDLEQQSGVKLVEADARLADYQPYWAARAALLARGGRRPDAAEAYRRAVGLEPDPAVRRFLQRRLAELGG